MTPPDAEPTTDPRLAEALERAASVAAAWGDFDPTKKQYLDGWAEAVQAHAERPESEHDGGCSAGISKLPCKCSQRDRTEAITKFCVAMLGERDE